ncbi:MAG TPA: PorV/PorQ family protein, partial [Daejeonella sp.]|nr:PorV/PorQ family protein [Daejeonella sp.]
MMIKRVSISSAVFILFGCFSAVEAQNLPQSDGKFSNTIQTAAPFLLIAPDARSGAMGDVGVAISPDANSLHWNPAKLAFMEEPTGFSVSYTPWLRNLVP